MTETASKNSTNLPINYVVAQEESSGTSNNSQNVSRSPSQSLLAQLSSSPYGWGSRSTSPTPPTIFSNSLRRVPSSNNRFMPHGHTSLQTLVKSFINKVSRGTQTDCDDNFDQVSIASLTSGFSAIESDLSRSRLKLFLNDPISKKNYVDESEFVEELQKLRDQIDGRFKYGFSSQPGSQSVSRHVSGPSSRSLSPKEYDDGVISLDLDRNLEDFGHISATHDQAIETDRCYFEDKTTQVDFVQSTNNIEKSTSSSFFFPFFQSQSEPEAKPVSFNVAIQTDVDLENLCSMCKQEIDCIDQEYDMKRADSIRFIPGTKQNVLKCQFLISPSDLSRKSKPEIFTFDEFHVSKANASTQVDYDKGVHPENELSNNNKEIVEGSISEKKTNICVQSAPNDLPGADDKGTKLNLVISDDKENNQTSTKLANGILKNGKRKKTKNMKIIPGMDDNDDNPSRKLMSHVRPKCCSVS